MKMHIADLLFALSTALDCVEKEVVGVTTNHSKRVALLSARLCEHLGFGDSDVFDMTSCAVLHDNALTEYTLRMGRAEVTRLANVELHCTSGERNASNFPFLGDTRHIILHHHENWDGSGYFKKQGREISPRAAVLRLSDHLDCLFSLGKPEEQTVDKARAWVAQQREILYAPDVADAFAAIFDEKLMDELSDRRIDAVLTTFADRTPQEVSLDDLLRICRIFSAITDAKSPHTAWHCQGVAQKTRKLAEALGLPRENVQRLVIAAHLHDVGKLAIPPEILEKPGPLTPEEFDIMREHAQKTEDILLTVRGLEEVTLWAASHHEKISGGGYPHGRSGDELPLESRVLACVDVYQALVEDRPYRGGMEHAQAMSILRRMGRSGALDAGLVEHLQTALQ